MSPVEELKVFSGNSDRSLAEDVCKYLSIQLGDAKVFKFSNDNIFVQYNENIRQRDVFIIQPFSYPVSDSIMELLIMIDAAKRASAGRITAVIPYFAYGRTDKKDQPRVPITGRLVADTISVAGADRILTMDLHAGQIQGFFNIPVDELTALPLLVEHFLSRKMDKVVVVAVDIGISKLARDMASRMDVPLAIIEKRRLGNADQSESLNVIGDVAGRIAITIDDEVDTAGSLLEAVSTLQKHGVTETYACCTHGVFSGNALEKIEKASIKELVVTDTLPNFERYNGSQKIKALTVAPLLGEAIHRIHSGLSVGAMFA